MQLCIFNPEHDLCLEEFLYLSDPHSLFVPGLTTYATF